MPRASGGGKQHGGGCRATARGALLGAVLLVSPLAAPAQDGPLVQRGVPAEATAENAVVARERAIQNAQRLAYQRMAGELGLSPGASASQIDSLVDSLIVEQERSTLTGYSGRMTVRFNPGRVAALGGRVPAAPAGPAVAGAAPAPLDPAPSAAPAPLPVSASVEAGARFASLAEWVALRRRLLAHPSVGRVEVLAIATDGALLRLGLRGAPGALAEGMAASGLLLAPAPPGAQPGPGWRVGLAGGA